MRITSKYLTGRRFECDVRGHTLVVDQPLESGGADAGPTPPELLVAALGTCVGVYALFYCEKHGIASEGLTVHTDWEKATAPARISRITVTIELPAGIHGEHYPAFMRTVEQCLVHNTLHQAPEVTIESHGPHNLAGPRGPHNLTTSRSLTRHSRNQ